MRLIRTLVVLAVAAAVVLIGLAFLARSQPPVASVFDTDARGPRVTFDDGPKVERAPRFRVLVGTSRKSARWVQVNVVQYAGCSTGDQWNGHLCSKAALQSGSSGFHLEARPLALGLIATAMVVTPLVAGLTSGKRHD